MLWKTPFAAQYFISAIQLLKKKKTNAKKDDVRIQHY
jgi:hypothetical protein